jgi:hypothetical protein
LTIAESKPELEIEVRHRGFDFSTTQRRARLTADQVVHVEECRAAMVMEGGINRDTHCDSRGLPHQKLQRIATMVALLLAYLLAAGHTRAQTGKPSAN